MLSNQLNYKIKTTQFGPNDKYLTSFQRQHLQDNLDDNLPWQYRQRIEIILLADEGKTQREICEAIGCAPGTARHWILITKCGQAHKWKDHPIGRPQEVNEQYLQRLKELVTHSPKEYGYVFRRWTANWLGKHLAGEFGIELSDRHINRLLKQMGLSTKRKLPKMEQTIDRDCNGKNITIHDSNSELNIDPCLRTLIFDPSKN
ncbi:MAG: helix-turn-helix domain-containing protein [Trichodesmium sp. MO_231.B1]|nr:helix-turn-helix domain-containing protein [Trichodesmium sp. MO_231.B1]